MKIILSPSKTQNIKEQLQKPHILFFDKTVDLFKLIKSLNKQQLADLLKIKGELLDKTYNLYQAYNSKLKGIEAIACYQGVVFENIITSDLNPSQKEFMNNHLIILSAMYGVVKANDIIWPYRLDMTNKPNGINLYNYWQNQIDKYFKEEDVIINLASNEFSKMLKNYKDKMINIHFVEKSQDGLLKVISYNAKKARGLMANYLIHNKVKRIDEIKQITFGDYTYNGELSDSLNMYFICVDQGKK